MSLKMKVFSLKTHTEDLEIYKRLEVISQTDINEPVSHK